MRHHYTRDFFIFGSLLILCALFAHSQSFSLTGTQCATVSADGQATAAVYIAGSWTGTIQPKISVAGQSAVNKQVIPSTSNVLQSTITGNGAYIANVAGASVFQVCGATITGTANIWIKTSAFTH